MNIFKNRSGLAFAALLCLGFSAARAWDPNKPFIYEMKIAFETDNWINMYSTATVLSKSDNAVAFRVVANSTTAPTYQLVVTTQGYVGIATNTISPAGIFTVGDGTLTVTAAGNVGVGTANPGAKLDVADAVIVGSGYGRTTFNAASYFGGSTYSSGYIHIKIPFTTSSYRMYHIRARGYAPSTSSSKIIDETWAGYVYGASGLTSTEQTGSHSPTQYIGSDNYLYLRFSPGENYYMTFVVDSMQVGNGRVIQPGEITITLSSSANL